MFAIECLHDRILHDRDYEMDFTDEQPEDSKALNSALGNSEGLLHIDPLAEPDGPQMLEVIRRLLINRDPINTYISALNVSVPPGFLF